MTVLASVRGTGCSSGEFDLFSWRSALDGKEVIDKWIPKQPWSNGDVAIFGHSYSGITGAFVASTRPEHLKAVSISGLIGDLYRDITYPGGVTNYGFPLLWTGAIRVVYDVGGGTLGGLYPVEDTSAQCAANQAERRRALLEDPLIHGLDDTDGNWYHSRSLVNYVDRINVPVHVTSAYQDEQTGPRGPTYVFDKLSSCISKRLVLVNGVHGTNTEDRPVQGPHGVARLLDAEQVLRGPRHEDGHRGPRDRVRPEDHADQDLARDPGLPGRRQGGR